MIPRFMKVPSFSFSKGGLLPFANRKYERFSPSNDLFATQKNNPSLMSKPDTLGLLVES